MKRYILYVSIFLAGLYAAGVEPLMAQEDPPFGEMPGFVKNEAFILEAPDTLIVFQNGKELFPYVNERPYYQDKRALNAMAQAEKRGDTTELDRLLVDYINNFGPQNFRSDIAMLWKAAQLKQAMNDTVQARFYYELFIKHTLGRSQQGRLAYDSLIAPTRSDWLPLEKYYELLEVRRRIDTLTPPKKVLTSMGPNVNSDKPDYAPFMHPGQDILIFTSRRDGEDLIDPFARKNEELYYSYKLSGTDEWVPAERLPPSINSEFNEGSACLSPDGKTLYFTRCGMIPTSPGEGRSRGMSRKQAGSDCEVNYGDCDIYQATYNPETDDWVDICNLGPHVNSDTWDSQPNISPDGNILFFASNRQGGFGGTDIYYTLRDTLTNEWSEARNLGPIINTPQQEVTPYFHRINHTLYFSSTGQLYNYGGYDIFKSRWMGNTWEEPNNVGPLVNTVGNEYYFTIDGLGETIFYARSNNEVKNHIAQNFDLYSFPMPMESQPAAVTVFRGRLRDSITGFPLVGTVMIRDLEKGTEIMPKSINEEGYFEFDLINNRRYQLLVMGDDFLTIKKDFEMNGDTTFQIFAQSYEKGKPIVFESLKFKSNSTRLKKSIQPKLDYMVKFLQAYPMFRLVVEGHTDADGDEDYNLQLSQERADKIAEYITHTGNFEQDRVVAIGYGETRPVVPNDTEENKSTNRRVEFKLVLNEGYDGPKIMPTQGELPINIDEAEPEGPTDEFGEEEDLIIEKKEAGQQPKATENKKKVNNK